MKILTCPKPCFTALLLLILALIFSVSPAFSTSPPKPDVKNQTTDLQVVSDEMVAQQNRSTVEFMGNVKVTRDDSVLTADSVKIFLHTAETRKPGQSNVKEIVATGHVVYTAGERKALADKAVYTTADEVLVLTGNSPKLLTGKSWVTGKKITLFRLEERVMVESDGSNRVQAFFDAQDQNGPTGAPRTKVL